MVFGTTVSKDWSFGTSVLKDCSCGTIVLKDCSRGTTVVKDWSCGTTCYNRLVVSKFSRKCSFIRDQRVHQLELYI